VIFFFVDGSFVVNEVSESQIIICGKEGSFDCSCNGLTLVFYSEAQVFGIGSKAIENENGVFSAQFCSFLQLLNTGNDLSREPSHFQLFALPCVKQNAIIMVELHNAVAADGFVLSDVVVHELFLNHQIALNNCSNTVSRVLPARTMLPLSLSFSSSTVVSFLMAA
jgi:hypothetical protein